MRIQADVNKCIAAAGHEAATLSELALLAIDQFFVRYEDDPGGLASDLLAAREQDVREIGER